MTTYILGLTLSLAAGMWFIIKPPQNRSWIFLVLAAGGAYLMTILFTHILPELFEVLGHQAGYVLLIGFLAQIFLENYSKGIEHGHAHASSSAMALVISFGALCLHALVEGMPLASALFSSSIQYDQELTIGIMLHKIPVAITLATLLNKSSVGKWKSALFLLFFISCTVWGSLLQHYFGSNNEAFIFITLGLTVGILLHVSTTILFESSDHHRLTPKRVAVIVIGVALGLLS